MKFQNIKREAYRTALRLFPYKFRLKLDYIRIHRRVPNLHTPRYHSERMMRRILCESDDLLSRLSSKKDMKKIAKERIVGTDIAIADTFWFGEASEVMDAVNWAEEMGLKWVLKPNNLGGGIVLIPEEHWNLNELKEATDRLIRQSRRTEKAYRRHAPIAWRDSAPGFILEQRIGAKIGMPSDYKIHVFHGEPRIISIYRNRATSLAVQHYDIDGTYLFGKNDTDMNLWPNDADVKALLEAAPLLSCDLPYTRVDFYIEEGIVWFGEISPFGAMDGLAAHPGLDQNMGALWAS